MRKGGIKAMVISKKFHEMNNETNMPMAFILGKYIITGLGVSRSLGSKNIPVLWLDSNPNQAGFLSKYCHGLFCPDLKKNEKEYVDFLMTIGNKLNKKGVIFPIGDIEVLTILKNRKKLEKYFHIPIADLNITKLLIDKKIFYLTLEKHGISYPKTFILKDVSELKNIVKEINYPCIVKPANSEYFRHEFNAKFFIASSSQQLLQMYNKAISKNLKVMIQEIIPGNAGCMYGLNAYYDKKFNSNGVFVYRRIREWPFISGNGVYIEKFEYSELEKIITTLVKKIKFYGILDAEFKMDPRDNKLNLIEINPRCWMQISFPFIYGINLPYIAYSDAIGIDFDISNIQKNHVKWLFAFHDILSAINDMKNHRLSLIDWISSYKGKKDYAIFSWKDPLPFFRYICKINYYY